MKVRRDVQPLERADLARVRLVAPLAALEYGPEAQNALTERAAAAIEIATQPTNVQAEFSRLREGRLNLDRADRHWGDLH